MGARGRITTTALGRAEHEILHLFLSMYAKLRASASDPVSSLRVRPPTLVFFHAILLLTLFCFCSAIGELMERRGR